jgi:ketosteroid isomerase-like protein
MSQENVKVVRRFFDALERRDFDAALKDVAPDCEFDASSNLLEGCPVGAPIGRSGGRNWVVVRHGLRSSRGLFDPCFSV